MKQVWKTGRLCAVLCLTACGAYAQALPQEWIDVPFGTYTAAYQGGSSYNAGTFTVIGSGNDMLGTAIDGGRFVFQPMQGDCEVVARVKIPLDAGLHYNARAGVMIRKSNDRGCRTCSSAACGATLPPSAGFPHTGA